MISNAEKVRTVSKKGLTNEKKKKKHKKPTTAQEGSWHQKKGQIVI